MDDNPDPQAALLTAQLRHAIDLLRGDINRLHAELDHYKELTSHRLAQLEKDNDDHEQRLRTVTDGVSQFKTIAGLASGGSTIASIIALFKAWLGG